jgi:alkylated DNA repair dioxygenase AlkB
MERNVNSIENVGFFSDKSSGYRYSNRTMKSIQLSTAMTELLDTVNRMLGSDFNGILVNQYIDGSDYISAHSDDEAGLDVIGVVSISYGSERTFRIRDKATKGVLCDVNMTHCSIVQMGVRFKVCTLMKYLSRRRSKTREFRSPFVNIKTDSNRSGS